MTRAAWMDFSPLELYFRTDVAALAQWFLVACATPVVLAWLAHHYDGMNGLTASG